MMPSRPSTPSPTPCQVASVADAYYAARGLARRCEALQERGLLWLNVRSGVSVWHSVGQGGWFLLPFEYPERVGPVFAKDPAVSAEEAFALPESSTRPAMSED